MCVAVRSLSVRLNISHARPLVKNLLDPTPVATHIFVAICAPPTCEWASDSFLGNQANLDSADLEEMVRDKCGRHKGDQGDWISGRNALSPRWPWAEPARRVLAVTQA
jgi:hypothetical protein